MKNERGQRERTSTCREASGDRDARVEGVEKSQKDKLPVKLERIDK